MDIKEIDGALEAILFVSGDPVKIARIGAVLDIPEEDVIAAADRLRDYYAFERRGITMVRLEETLQLCSSSVYAEYVRRALETRKPPQLSAPALEVLAIIAYFGPVTKMYIEQIRGVDSSYTVTLLVERELIEACGRLPAPGRPMLYRTTHNFLRTFGLESLKDLPDLPHVEGAAAEKEGIANAILELKAREAEVEAESAQEERTPGQTTEELQIPGGETSEQLPDETQAPGGETSEQPPDETQAPGEETSEQPLEVTHEADDVQIPGEAQAGDEDKTPEYRNE